MIAWNRVGYQPTPAALLAHNHPGRVILVAGGERGSKSRSASAEVVAHALLPNQLIWIVAPTYELALPEFNYALDDLSRIGMVLKSRTPSQGQRSLDTLLGTTIITRSAEDVLKLAATAPDAVLACEAAQLTYETFLRLRGRIAQKRGWLWLSGTFEGSLGWYPEFFTRWQVDNPEGARSFSLPSWSNVHVYPGGREDPEIKALEAAYPPDVFMERFGGVPCPPQSLVFKEFGFKDHVPPGGAPYWAGHPDWRDVDVELAVDPGYAGAYAVLALQKVGDTVWVIDEVYRQFTVAEDIIQECQSRPWWKKVNGGVIDIAGKQHQGLASHVEVWRKMTGLALRSNPVKISDGILRHRTFLRNPATGQPRLFHDSRCKGMLREYGLYKYRDTVEGRPVSEEPIDRDNHAMKAIAYYLYDRFGATDTLVERRRPVQGPVGDFTTEYWGKHK